MIKRLQLKFILGFQFVRFENMFLFLMKFSMFFFIVFVFMLCILIFLFLQLIIILLQMLMKRLFFMMFGIWFKIIVVCCVLLICLRCRLRIWLFLFVIKGVLLFICSVDLCDSILSDISVFLINVCVVCQLKGISLIGRGNWLSVLIFLFVFVMMII